MNRNVLVIEDQRDIANLIKLHIGDLGCAVDLAHDGVAGLAAAESKAYDLVILDLMLPGIDGLEVCRRLRAKPDYVPILIVTAKTAEFDRILGLELGADDYLTKPFSILELVARVRALFRRIDALVPGAAGTAPKPLRLGGFAIDAAKREVTLDNNPVSLTFKEFDLLLHFARNPGRVYSRMQLLDMVWGYGHDGYEHNVNCHINRLRAKIEKDHARPRFILTVRGVGYKFAELAGETAESMVFNTLHGKLIAVLVCLGITMAVMFLMVIQYSDTMRRQKTNQVIYRSLAAQFVDEHLLPDDAHGDSARMQAVFDRWRIINPRIDVYLLDETGRVLAYSGKAGFRKRDSVSLAPIREFLGDNAALPILGDDPSEEAKRRVFSAAPISHEGRTVGYLYLILRGLSGDSIAEQIRNNYFLRDSISLLAGGLLLALLAGALIIRLVTNRLHQLSLIVDRFRQNGFAGPPAPPSPRAAGRRDDIDHLAETFGQMADRITEQMSELKRVDALRRELIANISHDLRTPLAALQGYLETLQVKGDFLSPEEKNCYVAIALKQSQQLGRLTGNLFELAKLDAGQVKITVEPFVLEDLVQDVAQQFELAAANKQVRLEAVVPAQLPLVAADIGMIERVLKNLIDNALRYTPAGGRVRIAVLADAGHVRVQVADTGRGIDEHDLPRIFDRFYRGEKSREDYSGNAGLGLAIAKRVLELHGCSIEVASVPGIETTFTFTLPVAGDAARGGPLPPARPAAGRLPARLPLATGTPGTA